MRPLVQGARDTAEASETPSGGEVDAVDADTFGDEDTLLSSFAPDTAAVRSWVAAPSDDTGNSTDEDEELREVVRDTAPRAASASLAPYA